MSLEKKIKNKTFIIVNILLFIVLVALMNIDKIVLFFGGNFDKQNNIMIVDNTNKTYEIFKNTMEKEETIIDTGLKYKITKIDDEKKARKKVKKDEDIEWAEDIREQIGIKDKIDPTKESQDFKDEIVDMTRDGFSVNVDSLNQMSKNIEDLVLTESKEDRKQREE